MMFEHRSKNVFIIRLLLGMFAVTLFIGLFILATERAAIDERPDTVLESDGETTSITETNKDWTEVVYPGITFQAPSQIVMTYVSAIDWPPKVEIAAGPLTCVEAGEETARAGKTSLKSIHGRTFCVTVTSEGAAGSVYHLYAYAFEKNDSVVTLSFSTREVQCLNFPEEDIAACQAEQVSFSEDDLLARIADTVTLQH